MNENMHKAEELFETNRISEALDLYNYEIVADPNNILAYDGAVKCLFYLKQFDKAINLSNKALDINPNSTTSHALLAEIYYHLRDVETSWREAKEAYEIDPNLFQVLMTYGTLLLMEHKTGEAITFLEKAAQINPNSYVVHFNLFQAYIKKNDLKGQYIHSREIFRLRPNFGKGVQFVFSYLNLVRPISDLIFLVVSYLAIYTKLWLLLILPVIYIVLLVVGAVLLKSTKNNTHT